MTTIDDLGRAAAATALADARADLDVDHGLAAVLARAAGAAPTAMASPAEAFGPRPTRSRWLAVAASLAVLTGTGIALAVLSGDEHRTVVPVDTAPDGPGPDATLPGTTLPPDTADTAPDVTTPGIEDPAPSTEPGGTVATSGAAASTAPSTSLDTGDGYRVEPLGIDATCDPACTSLAFDPDGNLVVYDPAAATLQISGPTPRTVDVSAAGLNPEVSYLEVVSQDQVAYIVSQPPGALDPIGDLVAVATTGPAAGQVVVRADGVVDLSGDSDLVATPSGVVSVGCCDAAPMRPDPAAQPLLGWFLPSGVQSVGGPPDVRVEFDASTAQARVTRQVAGTVLASPSGPQRALVWTIAGVSGYRGLPPLVGTDDGGAMISLQDPFDPSSGSRLVVLHPDGTQEERSIDPYLPVALSPDGSVLVLGADGEYASLRLDGDAARPPALADDATAIAPFVDADVCTTSSSTARSSASTDLVPFAGSAVPPISIQVIGSPPPAGAAEPFAVILRYSPAPRGVGADTRRIGDWDVALATGANGNGEARWNLPDGTQGYVRSRGLDETALVDIVERLSARNLGAGVPGFGVDDRAAPSGLRLVVDSTATVDASIGQAICVVPATGSRYTITTLDGDAVFVFLGVIDRPVPLEVGVVGDDVVVIDGPDEPTAPTVADVVARPDGT